MFSTVPEPRFSEAGPKVSTALRVQFNKYSPMSVLAVGVGISKATPRPVQNRAQFSWQVRCQDRFQDQDSAGLVQGQY
jgi:hypothetical protein